MLHRFHFPFSARQQKKNTIKHLMFMLFFPAETYGLPSLLSGKKKKKKNMPKDKEETASMAVRLDLH